MLALLGAGATLGQYDLLRVIGSGGMGVVYDARHRTLGRRVAVKVLHPLALDMHGGQVVVERFLREGRVAAQVRHEHIVDVFDFGVQDGMPFLVMELIEGETLAERLEREKRLPLERAVEYLLPVVSAVADLHAAGILHRDLKPANILLAKTRAGDICPKVADFGVSRHEDGSAPLTGSGVVLGTRAYMSPEQATAGCAVTEQTDQYALGAILYQLVTGRLPLEGALRRAGMDDAPLRPTVHQPSLPPALDAIVLRALAIEPNARFPSVDDFGAALLPFASSAVSSRWSGEFDVSSPHAVATTLVDDVGPSAAPRTIRRASRVAASIGVLFAGVAFFLALRGAPHARSAGASEAAPPKPAAEAASPPSRAADEPAPVVAPRASQEGPVGAPAPSPSPPVLASHRVKTKPARPPQPSPVLDNGAPLLEP